MLFAFSLPSQVQPQSIEQMVLSKEKLPLLVNGITLEAFQIAWQQEEKLARKTACRNLSDYVVIFSRDGDLIRIDIYPRAVPPKSYAGEWYKFGVYIAVYVDVKRKRIVKSIIEDE